ncbi:MAG: hypothetical protein MRECE_11c009 [Mycoplasmataceae bacterium CE_OT135]|nr:MAG: hypothetical protein MRECE_31c008 [Mycoplasmataceae bacterium CE_OT135]KLL03657.1 MAG: hypothetical protein MRECE_11c009 [Mycoplasmataceae bacterium CE_OT135]
MYKNPHNYVTPHGEGIYSDWPDVGRTLSSNSTNASPKQKRDFEHLVTVSRICSTHRQGTSIRVVVHDCNCEDETTIKNLRNQLDRSQRENQAKDQEINELNQQLQEHKTCQAEKEELQKQITQLEKDKQELNQQLDQAWNELTANTRMEAKIVQQPPK